MLNLSLLSNAGFFIDRTTVIGTSIAFGNNTFSWSDPAVSLYAAKINASNYCVPIMWYIYNSTGVDFTLAAFKNGGGNWNSSADFSTDRWTILYPLDKPKGNHSHIDVINDYMSLSLTAATPPLTGGLTIYTVFTAVPALHVI